MVEELLSSAEEELQQVLCKQACSSPAHYPEHMVRLEEGVAKAMKEMDAEISQKKNEIEHLQRSLQSGMQNAVMLQAATQSSTDIKTSGTETGLTQEIDQLKIQLNNLILENAEAERQLKENNLDLNENDYEKEEEEFKRLEKPFSILEEECLQIQEKRRLAEEKRQKEMRELELKTKAAILAQAWWRGYSTRKALKNKGKTQKPKRAKARRNKPQTSHFIHWNLWKMIILN
ncbi:hypothetical protein INR49_006180 [Caranx melampygus]|nr:hypothetical protein INR49_006180 [Caranx melampygus]